MARTPEADREYHRKYYAQHREQRIAYTHEWNRTHREHLRAYRKKRYEQKRELILQQHKEWQMRNKEHVLEKHREWRRAHPLYKSPNYRLAQQKYHKQLKIQVLSHYGTNPPECVCCGEREVDFLTIDHVNGVGKDVHRKMGVNGAGLYAWLKRNNYPTDIPLRVLCMNCNFAIGHFGSCPHATKVIKFTIIR